jgi:hypothetical protein
MTEACENCGGMIGNLETPFVHRGHVVCGACKAKLSADDPHIEDEAQSDRPSSQTSDLDELEAQRFAGTKRPLASGVLFDSNMVRVTAGSIQLPDSIIAMGTVVSVSHTQVENPKYPNLLWMVLGAISFCFGCYTAFGDFENMLGRLASGMVALGSAVGTVIIFSANQKSPPLFFAQISLSDGSIRGVQLPSISKCVDFCLAVRAAMGASHGTSMQQTVNIGAGAQVLIAQSQPPRRR